MDKVVAVSTWPARVFAAGLAGALPRRVAVQPDRGIIPAHPPVSSVAIAQDGTHGSTAGLAALRRTSADARAPRTFAARVTNAIRIRRCGGRAATRSRGPGAYATLRVCAARRRALRCPKNRVDREVMMGILAREGFPLSPPADEAEVLVANTCSSIEAAQRESV